VIALWILAALQRPAAPVVAVERVSINVAELERSVRFFTEVLDFELVGTEERSGPEPAALEGVFGLRQRIARVALGDERLELVELLAPRGRAYPEGSRSNDRWFQHVAIVVSDLDAAYARLRAHGVRHASSGPQRLPDWNPNAGGIEAFYFEDPDGHVLEVIEFPPDKGDPRWQTLAGSGERLFLGIDHTAIVVADTDASLTFWRDALGLVVAGGSENWGTEQEHLNNVFGARLRITTLRAASGPGVELLEYLSPGDGRAYPADARANDLVHWETHLAARSLDPLLADLRGRRARFVSSDVVAGAATGRGVLVRDPDGHAVELHELESRAGVR